MMRRLLALALFLALSLAVPSMAQTYKSLIGEEDLNLYSPGAATTFSRRSSTGGTVTMTKVGAGSVLVEEAMGVYQGSGDLSADIAAIGATETTLVIGASQTLSGNVTVPTNVTLEFGGGAVVSCSGKTLTVNGYVGAGMTQIFDCAAQEVRFPPETSLTKEDRPEWWGVDGTADEVEINKAIDAFALYNISDPGDRSNMANWPNQGVVKLLGEYTIASPIIMETNTEVDKISRNGIVLDGELKGVIKPVSYAGFTGVTRYKDSSQTETIKAMVMIGAKNFGKDGGQYGGHQKLYGLEFQGNLDGGGKLDEDLIAIWSGPSNQLDITHMRFQYVFYCFKARVIIDVKFDNWNAYQVGTMISNWNDTPDLKLADAGSGWGSGGDPSHNNNVSNMYGRTDNIMYNDTAANEERAVFEFRQSNEWNLVNIMFFGGLHLMHFKNVTVDGQNVGQKWNRITNVELDECEGWAVKFDNVKYVQVSNMQLVWNVANKRSSAHFDYTEPYMILEDVVGSQFSNLLFDRNTAVYVAHAGGESLELRGASTDNTFTGVVSVNGQGIGADDTYSHIKITDTASRNSFSNLELGTRASSGNSMKYCVEIGNSANYNIFTNVTCTNTATGNIDFGTATNNVLVPTGGLIAPTDQDTTPSVFNANHVRFNNTATTNVTDFDEGTEGQIIVVSDIAAASGYTTLVDSATLRMNGNWTPGGTHDSITLQNRGTVWHEIGRTYANSKVRNCGTATLGSGDTTDVIAHGLLAAPTVVTITPQESLGSSGEYWVDTIGATNFTVNVDVAPGGDGLTYGWCAETAPY